MAPLKILICGCGHAGPALAMWLSRLGCDITIVERFPSLRTAGQQVDLRGQGVQVMKKMGIEREVRAAVVDEAGIEFVDRHGKSAAFVGANKTGKGRQSFTSEFEIMRGDLCRIIYDTIKDRVKFVFGTSVESSEQDGDSVKVRFSDGREDRFDLLVGADGQGSRTRRRMLGADAPDAFRWLGVYTAYFTVPHQEGDKYVARIYHTTDKRVIFTRKNCPETLQVYLTYMSPSPSDDAKLSEALGKPVPEQKKVWAELYRDSGWQSNRFVDAMTSSPVADDFYFHQIGQVKTDTWSQGGVVLLGDSAYCPSLFTGRGTTCGLVGAYVLAGEIAHHCKLSPDGRPDGPDDDWAAGLQAALKAYDARLRPFIDKVQRVNPKLISAMTPSSQLGVSMLHWTVWMATTLKLDKLATWAQDDDAGTEWELPEYPELARLNLQH